MSAAAKSAAHVPPTLASQAIAAILALACLAGLVPTLQPLLLGALAAEGRLSTVQIGHAAMLEAAGMGLSSGLAGAFLQPVRLRRLIAIALLLGLGSNLAAVHGAGAGLLVARFMCGVASGLLVWLFAGMTARAADPTRIGGAYVVAQGASGLAAAALLTSLVLPQWGAAGGYLGLAALDVLLLGAVLIAPRAFPPLSDAAAPSRVDLRGGAALIAALLHLAAIMALWVYFVPLAARTGQSTETTEIAVWAALAAQIAAGVVAAAISAKLRPTPALMVCVVASLAAIAQIAAAPPAPMFIAAATAFGFFWMFAIPFQIPFMIAVDPSRRAALLLPSAQISGVAAGPAIAAWSIDAGSLLNAFAASAAMFVASMALILALLGRGGTRRAEGPATARTPVESVEPD